MTWGAISKDESNIVSAELTVVNNVGSVNVTATAGGIDKTSDLQKSGNIYSLDITSYLLDPNDTVVFTAEVDETTKSVTYTVE